MTEEVLIPDTSALIGGYTPNLEKNTQYIVPQILEEARSLSARLKLETGIRSGQVKVKEPSPQAMEEVKKEVQKTNDRVSETDTKILALAHELKAEGKKPVIVTDDYAIQNLSEILEIKYSEVAKPGIDEIYKWKKECPACGRVYSKDILKCEACGTRLIRKPED
ncbi:MAG: NOB1 family endonuclease [Candidatus Hadarchaeia archaeon]